MPRLVLALGVFFVSTLIAKSLPAQTNIYKVVRLCREQAPELSLEVFTSLDAQQKPTFSLVDIWFKEFRGNVTHAAINQFPVESHFLLSVRKHLLSKKQGAFAEAFAASGEGKHSEVLVVFNYPTTSDAFAEVPETGTEETSRGLIGWLTELVEGIKVNTARAQIQYSSFVTVDIIRLDQPTPTRDEKSSASKYRFRAVVANELVEWQLVEN